MRLLARMGKDYLPFPKLLELAFSRLRFTRTQDFANPPRTHARDAAGSPSEGLIQAASMKSRCRSSSVSTLWISVV